MRIHQTSLAILVAMLIAAPAAMAQDATRHSRQIDDLPENRQDTGLAGQHAAEALQKAGLLAVITGIDCSKPSLQYNTVPLSRLLDEQDIVQESEIWYFGCPEISPVLVHYWRIKGEISKVHVHEFGTFMRDLPLRPLASQRIPKFSMKNFPKRTALHEAVCFGILSEELARSINSKTPRLSTRSESREDRQMCLRMQACNTIEPELDILQDISLDESDDSKEWAGFVKWCNGKDPRILMIEEPEMAYGLMQLLPKVPDLAERHPKVVGERK